MRTIAVPDLQPEPPVGEAAVRRKEGVRHLPSEKTTLHRVEHRLAKVVLGGVGQFDDDRWIEPLQLDEFIVAIRPNRSTKYEEKQ